MSDENPPMLLDKWDDDPRYCDWWCVACSKGCGDQEVEVFGKDGCDLRCSFCKAELVPAPAGRG